MSATAQIDYDALAQQQGGQSTQSVDYDALAQQHGGTSDAQEPEGVIKRTARGLLSGLGLPETLSEVPAWASRGIPGLDPNAVAPKKEDIPLIGPVIKAFEKPSSESIAGAIPIIGPTSVAAAQKVRQGDYGGAFGTAVAAPLAITAGSPSARGALLDPVTGGQNIWSKVSPTAKFEQAVGTRLTPAEADTPRPGGQIQPALNNTPREVLQHAHDEGIDLTPGQATENALAQNAQKSGINAASGGRQLQAALNAQRTQFGQAINNFMDEVDPPINGVRRGATAESAGQAIQQAQGVAKGVSHDNAAQGYQKIDYLMDKPVNSQPISAAWNQVKQNLPMGAEESILAQTPRSMRAVVEDMLSGKPEGFNPTFNQAIQLRKFFRDMGDTQGLPNQTQAMFKQMSGAVDGAMQSTASQLNAAADWRSANAGWKDYATKYGDPQSILYKIGRQQDPTKIVTMLQNAPATDIMTVKQEMGDAALEPLRRQVIQDIAQSRFNIGHDGIGGYSDQYLKALFPPEQVKELYLKGDLANRLKYDPNPSGTAGGLQALEQLTFGNQGKMAIAARLSMPKDALSYLPEGSTSSPASRGQLAPPISIASNPVNVSTDSLGIRWASDGENRVSIPRNVPDKMIDSYARPKLAEQKQIRSQLFSSGGGQ